MEQFKKNVIDPFKMLFKGIFYVGMFIMLCITLGDKYVRKNYTMYNRFLNDVVYENVEDEYLTSLIVGVIVLYFELFFALPFLLHYFVFYFKVDIDENYIVKSSYLVSFIPFHYIILYYEFNSNIFFIMMIYIIFSPIFLTFIKIFFGWTSMVIDKKEQYKLYVYYQLKKLLIFSGIIMIGICYIFLTGNSYVRNYIKIFNKCEETDEIIHCGHFIEIHHNTGSEIEKTILAGVFMCCIEYLLFMIHVIHETIFYGNTTRITNQYIVSYIGSHYIYLKEPTVNNFVMFIVYTMISPIIVTGVMEIIKLCYVKIIDKKEIKIE